MDYSSETENKIVASATEVFLESGRDGARMQEIADRAGINKALLHYYFRSKNRLYDKVFETIISFFLNNMLESVKERTDAQTMLRTFIDKYIDALAKRPQIVRFVLWEIERGGEGFANAAKKTFAKKGFNTIPLIPIIQEAVDRGEIRPVDPVQLTLSIVGMCIYPFVAKPLIERVIPGVQVYSKPFLEQRKQEIFRMVWSGIAPE